MFRHDPEEQVESQKLDIHPNEKLEQMSGGGLKSRTGFHFCSEANTQKFYVGSTQQLTTSFI